MGGRVNWWMNKYSKIICSLVAKYNMFMTSTIHKYLLPGDVLTPHSPTQVFSFSDHRCRHGNRKLTTVLH